MDLESVLAELITGVRSGDGATTSRTLAEMIAPLVGGISLPGLTGTGGTSGVSGAASASSFLGGLVDGGGVASGLGSAVPLLGLLGLLGGSQQESVATPVRFELPAASQLALGFDASSGGLSSVDYGDRNTLRTSQQPVAPQINIQVSAMDAKSFLDRSADIADAVRSAVLQSHSLSDVLTED